MGPAKLSTADLPRPLQLQLAQLQLALREHLGPEATAVQVTYDRLHEPESLPVVDVRVLPCDYRSYR